MPRPTGPLISKLCNIGRKRALKKDEEFQSIMQAYADAGESFPVLVSDQDKGISVDDWIRAFELERAYEPRITETLRKVHNWHPFSDIRDFIQRGRRGFADNDVYQFHVYHARLVSEMIQHLRDNHFSHPTSISPEQWEEILDEISEGMHVLFRRDDELGQNTEPSAEEVEQRLHKTFDLMKKYYFDLWD